MAHGGTRSGAGRPKGSKNRRTAELEERSRQAAAAIERALDKPFMGDGLAFLQVIYRDPGQPLEMRLEAAGKALRFERPSLAAIDVTTDATVRHVISPEPLSPEQRDAEWIERFGSKVH